VVTKKGRRAVLSEAGKSLTVCGLLWVRVRLKSLTEPDSHVIAGHVRTKEGNMGFNRAGKRKEKCRGGFCYITLAQATRKLGCRAVSTS